MKSLLPVFVLAGVMAATAGCAQAAPRASYGTHALVVVSKPPPPRHARRVTVRTGHVWAGGYWRWNGRRHVWVDGRWLPARRGFVYVSARWKPVRRGWRFVPGHWVRR